MRMTASQNPQSLLSLPTGGGALKGMGETFAPDLHTGTGNFTVPLALLPGRNGFEPRLSLAYSTGHGNGLFGMGWSLSVPSVTRKTAKGIPRYRDRSGDLAERDTFVLSGVEDLVFVGRVNDEANVAVDQYRPRTEGLFAEIFRYRDDTAGSDYWRLRTKDGHRSFYGTNPAPSAHPQYDIAPASDPAVIARPGRAADIFEWRLTLTLDPFGNRIEYLYDSDAGEGDGHEWKQPLLAVIRYGDYGDRANPAFLVTATFQYEDREDAFSDYRAGFEIRTARRCRALLVETHADRLRPTRRYELTYRRDSLTALSLLRAIDIVGFDDQGAESRELPPLEFGYTEFDPQNRTRRDFYPLQGADLPMTALTNASLELVDLFGCGLPDFFEMSAAGVRYWRNRGSGRFDVPRAMDSAPPETLAATGVQLLDANGDGRTDLLVTRNNVNGYYPLEFGGLWDRRSFRPYAYAPSFDLEDPEVHLVDLTGDGITDVIRSGTRLECFFNDARDGWQPHNRYWADRGPLEDFPNVSFSDPRVKWGDFSGDGLQDIALVHDGNVEFWPNCGYGRWSRRLHMKRSPRFPFGYDPKRILVGDVNGDGLADIVYVDDRKIYLWINQSGNAWSEPIEIHGTPPVSDVDALRLVDLLGSGVAGILWTKDARTPTEDHFFFLDLTGGTKPYLLDEMDNNLGAVTKVGYAPSTRFYLDDEQHPARRWRTPLPFPVQVVARVEVIDEVSQGKLTSEYRYHGGYWDGVDREFRGFACVEQLDTESFTTYSQPGLHGANASFAAVDQQFFSPPTLTKTWFHQGPIGDDATSLQEIGRQEDLWPGDVQQFGHVAGINQVLAQLRQQYVGLTSREKRQIAHDALRSLRGSVLRTEMYGLDGTARQDRPYTVTEHAYGFREEAAPAGPSSQHRIFFPFRRAQRTTQWERGDDPMTSLAYSSDYDAFGNPLSAIQVACPRGWRGIDDAVRDATFLATVATTEMAAPAAAAAYIHDRVARTSQFEVLNPPVANAVDPGRTVAGVLALAQDPAARRVISESIHFYDDDSTQPNNGEFVGLPFGVVGGYGALTRSESLVLTDAVVNDAYGGQPPPYLQPGQPFVANATYPSAFVQQLAPLAGYVYHAAGRPYAGGYYVPYDRKRFDFHGAGPARGLVLASIDALGVPTTIQYDQPYGMLAVGVVDAANLSVRASHNYRVLQPQELTDANDNRTSVTFSSIGLVTAAYTRGKANQNEGDTAQPSVALEYDFLARPAYVRTIRSVRHDFDPENQGDTIEARDYSDGFGRLIQTRAQAERERFGDAIFGGGDSILPARQAAGRGGTVEATVNNDAQHPNVTVSGWQRYDNKGRVVETFEPFFAAGWEYARPRDAADPSQRDYGAKVTTFYDPLGRATRTVYPDGSERRGVYGVPRSLEDPVAQDAVVPTPWESFTYDTNDNAGRTHPASSADYLHHWNTPQSSVVDALGRAVVVTVRNREKPASAADPLPAIDEYRTRSVYDIQGNLLELRDPLNRTAFVNMFDLAAHVLRTDSVDAGTRAKVFDAMGREIECTDARGACTLLSYDVLDRPDRVWARNDISQSVTLRRRAFYGDGGDANQPQAARNQARGANALGRLVRQLDECGELSFDAYDFKGNVIGKTRRVIADAPLIAALDAAGGPARQFAVDWDHAPALSGAYETTSSYDALNRTTAVQYPQDVNGDRKTLVPTYNRAGALESASLDGQVFVERIAYNAKGQRVLIAYGNQLMTRYAYDAATMRLVRLRTEPYVPGALAYTPQGTALQDFAYVHDLAGNVRTIVEQTPGCGVRNNVQAAAHPELQVQLAAGDALVRTFDYDPLYRLTAASGREANNIPTDRRPWRDLARDGFDWGLPGTPGPETARDLTRLYQETYSYDAADNLLALRHGSSWTRYFGISGSNSQEWAQQWATHLDPANAWPQPTSNRLTHAGRRRDVNQTHFFDDNGNLVREHSERHFGWDASDRLVAFANRAGNGNATVEVCYLYDADGQRTKKLVRKGQNVEVTIYIDDVFEHHTSGAAANNSLHIMDDSGRIALVRVGPALQGDTGPDVQYHLRDNISSSHIVTGGADSAASTFTNREEFFPFGDTSFGSYGRKRYRFTGRERDEETGASYHGARYYAPWLSRWIGCDPMGPVDSSNLYVYAALNPVSCLDTRGCQAASASNLEITESVSVTENQMCAGTVASCQTTSVTKTWTRIVHNVETGETVLTSTSVTTPAGDAPVPVLSVENADAPGPPSSPANADDSSDWSTWDIIKDAVRQIPDMLSKTSEERAEATYQAFRHSGQSDEEARKNTGTIMGTAQNLGYMAGGAIAGGMVKLATPSTNVVYGGFDKSSGRVVYIGRASGSGSPATVVAQRVAKGHILKGSATVEARPILSLPSKDAAKGAEGALHDYFQNQNRLYKNPSQWLNSPKSPPLGKSAGRLNKSFDRIEDYWESVRQGGANVSTGCPAADTLLQGVLQRGGFRL
jgi:RHS repeat-associated protein